MHLFAASPELLVMERRVVGTRMLGEVACGFSSPHFHYIRYLTCTLPTSPLYNLTLINYTCFLSDSVAEMRHQDKFPGVHWIWKGGISYVFEVHPRIVVKVPKSGEFEREQFQKELDIYNILSRSPPCASLVQCFYKADKGIFLEYMRGTTFRNVQIVGLTDYLTRYIPPLQNARSPD